MGAFMSDIIAAARVLLERITFDTCGEHGRGGNGGLVSTETVKAADQLRLALSRGDSRDREIEELRGEITRLNRELFRASAAMEAAR
jgi:hypothetical protein